MRAKNLSKLLSILTVGGQHDAVIKLQNDKTLLYTVDVNHVAVITLTMPEKYCTEDAFIDLKRIINYLNVLGNKDVSVNIDSKKTYIKSDTQEFEVSNLDASLAPSLPKLPTNFHVAVEVPTDEFKKFLELSNAYTIYYEIVVDEKEISFRSMGSGGDSTELLYLEDMLPSFSAEGKAKSLYSINWCLSFLRKIPTPTVKLEFSEDAPLKISSTIENNDATLFLAPTLDNV